jgi:Domain of unknown function (DUF4333)
MPATTNRRAATGQPIATSRAPLWFTVTTGRVGRLVRMITLLLAAVLAASCSATVTVGARDTVDPARVSASLTTWLKDRYPDVQVGGIACPSGVKLTVGRTFECTADMEGAQLPITVTLTHVDKEDYTSNFKLTKALIYTDKVIEELRSNLPVKVNFEPASATVDCGTPRVRVVEVGGTIECTVAKGDARHVVRVVIEDVAGKGHFELANQPPPRPAVATGKVGDTLTVFDEFGAAQLEVTITRVKFSKGDQLDRPRRGLYMGGHVKAHALADDQYPYDLYARVGGHLYEQAIAGFAFEPLLEPVPLNKASGRPAGPCSTSRPATASWCCATWTTRRSESGPTDVGAAGGQPGKSKRGLDAVRD